jgi:hypothetical protein
VKNEKLSQQKLKNLLQQKRFQRINISLWREYPEGGREDFVFARAVLSRLAPRRHPPSPKRDKNRCAELKASTTARRVSENKCLPLEGGLCFGASCPLPSGALAPSTLSKEGYFLKTIVINTPCMSVNIC